MGTGYLRSIGYRDTLDYLVVAFCKDYFFRKAQIESATCSRRIRMEYEYVNRRISEAAREVVGDDYEIYIKEIGEGIGYANSELPDVSESRYKTFKREVKINIAKKLHLLD